jgi:citrate lyase subunit beta / citryl-CoA lyase
MATMARNLGFKGALCPHPSWIEPVNAAFSPTAEQVAYYTKVREVFAEGVARGTAAVPLDGKMIDVPVDEWAKVVLHLAALCQARDEAKQQALRRTAAL